MRYADNLNPVTGLLHEIVTMRSDLLAVCLSHASDLFLFRYTKPEVPAP